MAAPGTEATAGSSLPSTSIREGGGGLATAGPSNRGPAFSPIGVFDLESFVLRYGRVDPTSFAALAVDAWMSNSAGCNFIRLLGIGDGNKRVSAGTTDSAGENLPAGGVKNSGFVVGTRLTGSNGRLSNNSYAAPGGALGRTYFLGAFMSESKDSTYFSDAGLQTVGENVSVPILRGVLFAASGVLPALSGTYTNNASTASAGATVGIFADKQDGGATVGAVNISAAKEQFVLLLNGHTKTVDYSNTITASFNPKAVNEDAESIFFANVLNTDPDKLQQAGHYLYTYFDITQDLAVVTGSGIVTPGTAFDDPRGDRLEESAFLVTSSIARNAADSAGSLEVPNFENFSDRYQTAKSPFVISQYIDRQQFDLFRFHAIDDGNFGNDQVKITIKNIQPGADSDTYGTFDVVIRAMDNLDNAFYSLSGSEGFTGCNLDPSSDNYIARVIGDRHTFYDFDVATKDRQKLVQEGEHRNNSGYVRVEVSDAVKNQTLPRKILPAGYRGFGHMVISGSNIMSLPQHPLTDGSVIANTTEWSRRIHEPPVPYRIRISDDPTETGITTGERTLKANLCWGVQTTTPGTVLAPNRYSSFNESIRAYTTYFPSFTSSRQKVFVDDNVGVADSAGTVYDVDRYCNNKFSLENILVHTSSAADIIDDTQWAYSKYSRSRTKESLIDSTLQEKSGVRFLNFDKDVTPENIAKIKDYLKFTFFMQGGFDATNMFVESKRKFTNLSAYFENQESAQGRKIGATTGAYLKAIDILSEKSDSDFKLLALPGIRIQPITNYALEMVEDRFDAFYIMDVEEVDTSTANIVTSSNDVPSPALTAQRFESRALDSTFGATYFPDVSIENPEFDPVFVPPSIAVVRVFSRLESQGNVQAPTGVTRGRLNSEPDTGNNFIQTKIQFDSTEKETIETLFNAGINPIISDSNGLMLFGQRTFLTSIDSMLQRINIRRMVIDIRRAVKTAARGFYFQQNKESDQNNLAAAIEPVLVGVLNQGGIERYKVIIDETTTSQADIEANIVRGKVFIQPTNSEQIVQVDFST